MYLWGEFKNILEHRDFPQLLSSWPSDNDVQILVDAADGLLSRCCVALCGLSTWLVIPWKTTVCLRLPLPCRKTGVDITLFATRCTISPVMKQILESILLSSKFLFSWNVDTYSYASMPCCMFRISRSKTFVTIYMPWFHTRRLLTLSAQSTLTQSCSDQGQWFYSDELIIDHVLSVHGTFLSQILLRFPRRPHSLWCLLCQHSYLLNLSITWFKTTNSSISLLVSVPEFTCYHRACVGTEYCQLLCITLLATRNWVRRLLSQAGEFWPSIILVIPWWLTLLSIFRWYSVQYLAIAGRSWLSQVSDSGPDVVGTQWFVKWYCFRHLGDFPNVVPYYIWAYSLQWIWCSGGCCIYLGTFPTMVTCSG